MRLFRIWQVLKAKRSERSFLQGKTPAEGASAAMLHHVDPILANQDGIAVGGGRAYEAPRPQGNAPMASPSQWNAVD